MTNIRLPAHAVLPATEADNDGRCTLTDLLPPECGCKRHRNSPDLGIVDELPDAA